MTISIAAWIILKGATNVENGTPPGRQCEVGTSLPWLCPRCFNRAAASGRMGSSPGLKSARTFRKYFENVCKSIPGRSEERRVGKEDRARGSADRSKKK